MKTSYALKWIAFAFAAVVAVSGAKAADWKPTSDVEFVIPYGLGGGADLLARVIIKIMTEEKLVPVNVTAVNKPGGGASVGVAYVLTTKNANPNTLVLFNPQTQITPLTVKDARGWRDLTPVANLMLDDYLLFVGKDSPYKTAADLVKDAKSQASEDDLCRLRRHGRRHVDRGLRIGGGHQAQRRALQFRRRGADRAARRPRQPGIRQPT